MSDNFCRLCPRNCGVNRAVGTGYCGVKQNPVLGRAALHYWEEPVVADERGSGAVFFAGCSLKCVYCQNFDLSRGEGTEISVSRLADIFKELEDNGACNIDLVTGSHFIPQIAKALNLYKPAIPVIFNCGGYEKTDALRMLDGLVDIYMPDFKYSDRALAEKYSAAGDYPDIAVKAVKEMKRQVKSTYVAEDGLMKRGLLVRHLVLPGAVANSKGVLDILERITDIKNDYFSLMSQYTPFGKASEYPEINRKLKPIEYKTVVAYAKKLGFENVFVQEAESACEEYIPDFRGQGVLKTQ